MSFMEIRDGAGAQYYLRTGNTGSSTDPFVMSHLPFALSSEYVSGFTTNISTTTSHTVIAAQSTNIKIYITNISASNSSTQLGTFVNIYDGATSSGTLKHSRFCGTQAGYDVSLQVPIVCSANTALSAACESTNANVRVVVSGFIGR